VFVRWLLQLVFPHPCFLWDEFSVAAHFKIDVQSFRKAVKSGKLEKALSKLKYKGLFAGFLGDRWWRAGIEHFAWKIANKVSKDDPNVVKGLSEVAGIEFKELAIPFPVVCRDEKLRPIDAFQNAEACVRLKPEFWPGFADQPWTSIDQIKGSNKLRAIVDPNDLSKIPS
jgi:hypothetical protein